jgi:glycosyltransferase involved in cell wall biosynthesis
MSRPTRVAVVAPQFPPEVGGLASYVGWATRLLDRQDDIDVVVLAAGTGRRTLDTVEDGVRVIRLGTWFHLSNTPINPLWPLQLWWLFRRLGTEMVLAHSPVPFLADVAVLVSGRRPVVLTYHAGSLLKGGGAVDVLLGAYERFVLPRVFRACAVLIAVSPVSSAFKTGRAALIPPGVDTTVFTPPAADQKRERSVMYVGRIQTTSRWKGLEVLLGALPQVVAQVPDVVLDMVGEGDAVPGLKALATELGVADHVRWHGGLSPEGVAGHYRSTSATVLPSLTEAESFGMVLVEAMASGCPVVGSEVGGIPYVVRDEVDGLIVSPGDVHALATALVRLLEDPHLVARMGREGRRAAEERWDWRLQEKATLGVVRGAVPGRSCTDPQESAAARKAYQAGLREPSALSSPK